MVLAPHFIEAVLSHAVLLLLGLLIELRRVHIGLRLLGLGLRVAVRVQVGLELGLRRWRHIHVGGRIIVEPSLRNGVIVLDRFGLRHGLKMRRCLVVIVN